MSLSPTFYTRIATEVFWLVLNAIIGIFSFGHILMEIQGHSLWKTLHPPKNQEHIHMDGKGAVKTQPRLYWWQRYNRGLDYQPNPSHICQTLQIEYHS